MSTASHRSVRLERLGFARFRATNPAGATIEFGADDLGMFTPVELLLAAIGGCSAIDVDYIVSKRDEPTAMDVGVAAEKVRDSAGNHLVNIHMTLAAGFAATDTGRAAREVLPTAVQRSHDRLCTVARTVELGTPVTVTINP